MGKYMQNAPPEWKGILIAWNYRKFRTKVSTMKTSATHLEGVCGTRNHAKTGVLARLTQHKDDEHCAHQDLNDGNNGSCHSE